MSTPTKTRDDRERGQHLIDALDSVRIANRHLASIDLRTCSKEVRPLVKQARANMNEIAEVVNEAVARDLPMMRS